MGCVFQGIGPFHLLNKVMSIEAFVCVCVCVCAHTHGHAHAQSCPTLCEPMDCSPPGSSVHGIFQARILELVAMSYSRGSSRPRDQTHISCTGRQILYHRDAWEAPSTYIDTHESTETFWVPLLNYCCESSTIIQNFTSHKKYWI